MRSLYKIWWDGMRVNIAYLKLQGAVELSLHCTPIPEIMHTCNESLKKHTWEEGRKILQGLQFKDVQNSSGNSINWTKGHAKYIVAPSPLPPPPNVLTLPLECCCQGQHVLSEVSQLCVLHLFLHQRKNPTARKLSRQTSCPQIKRHSRQNYPTSIRDVRRSTRLHEWPMGLH